MTLHADEEMDADGFTIVDVENALLTGELVGRQTDRESRERKYLIQGSSADRTADLVVVVVKFGLGNQLVIVTVYANESWSSSQALRRLWESGNSGSSHGAQLRKRSWRVPR